MEPLRLFVENNLTNLHMPSIGVIDVLEIVIISFAIYHILVWLRNTRAWSLMKGILSILFMLVIAALLEMNTILWIVQNVAYMGVIAIIVVLQPELRKALEALGKRNFSVPFYRWTLEKQKRDCFLIIPFMKLPRLV